MKFTSMQLKAMKCAATAESPLFNRQCDYGGFAISQRSLIRKGLIDGKTLELTAVGKEEWRKLRQ